MKTTGSRIKPLAISAGVLLLPAFLLAASDDGAEAHCGEHDHHGASLHDPRGPAGIMGEHLHPRDSERSFFLPNMFSYRYMEMGMDGMRGGTDDFSTSDVLGEYMVAPEEMEMRMHMFGLMFAPLDRFNLMVMVDYRETEMEHVDRNGNEGRMENHGFGDTVVSGVYQLYRRENHQFLLNFGLSLPTADLGQKGEVHGQGHAQHSAALPYSMQLGSGTWDLLPGITYTGGSGLWSWGAQALGTIRTGENDRGYRLGNATRLTAWGGYRWIPALSTSVRVDAQRWGSIDGSDAGIATERMGMKTSPTADPDNSGGERIDLLLGVNLIGQGQLAGHRLSLEVGLPVYEDLDGLQMSVDRIVNFAWSYSF